MRNSLPVILLLLACGLDAAVRDLYVDNRKGDDRHAGTDAAAPLATLARAVALLQPGDTLHLANSGRPYRESLRLFGKSGTPAAPLVVDGGGAVLTGLEVTKAEDWEPQPDGTLGYRLRGPKLAPNCCPVLRDGDQYVPVSPANAAVPPGHYAWADGLLRYRPAAAAAPGELAVSARECGVQLHDASYIRVGNLVCEGFYNDGFNFHGDCQDLLFANVEARYNGDDGFSAHEDVSVTFRDSYAHHNRFGIADICTSQTDYINVRCEANATGVVFAGGVHRLIGCDIRDSTTGNQVRVDQGHSPGGRYGDSSAGPLYAGLAFIRNTRIAGGKVGLRVSERAQAMVMASTISDCETGLQLLRGATAELRASRIEGCRRANVETPAKALVQGGNQFAPGRFMVADQEYGPDAWAAFLAALGSAANGSTIVP